MRQLYFFVMIESASRFLLDDTLTILVHIDPVANCQYISGGGRIIRNNSRIAHAPFQTSTQCDVLATEYREVNVLKAGAAGGPGPHVSLVGVRRDGGRYAWYVCLVLMLLLAISYMDRSVLALLVAPIETAFPVRDTTMGLLQGAAFAVVYVLFAFPLARLADRGNRRNLIVYGVIFWCGATICCGFF